MSVQMRVWSGLMKNKGDGENREGSHHCYMHMRPTGGLCDDVLLSMTLVTKTELGDLVLVGKEMDPKLAGLLGSAASGNDDTISDLTSVSFGTPSEVASLPEERGLEGGSGDYDSDGRDGDSDGESEPGLSFA